MSRRDEPIVLPPTEPALRIIMRRLREIMAEANDGQARLDRIVKQIAGVMVADVCSIYLKRQDASLELFATHGLKAEAVHNTRLKRNEGLVGVCAETREPINEPEAASNPHFVYRPETGEELYHSLLAVPIIRGGIVMGVLVVQNQAPREYSEEDVEVLESMAMFIAEHLVSGAVANAGTAIENERQMASVIKGEAISDGIALGHIYLHDPRIVVSKMIADDPADELDRLETALGELRASLDEMLEQEQVSGAGEHREVLEAYRMFAHDKGWARRMRELVEDGLTAQGAVVRVQEAMRTRMLKQNDAYWRERQRDLDDLSDRLLRILAGQTNGSNGAHELPQDTIIVARTMGPAELLDYDQTRVRAIVLEDSSGQSHVAIVAKALGIAAVGQATGITDRVTSGDSAIVDAETGEVHLRPSAEVIAAYRDKARFRARRQKQYEALRDTPAKTKDGQRIGLHMNAGLLVDMPHLAESGADGIGLFRTELQFMLSQRFPRLDRQVQAYRAILAQAGGRPVVFRALDIGGDKTLPYLRRVEEENPALGWRAIRMSLDRPALFRTQVRAFLHAAQGAELNIMIPMVTVSREMDRVREAVDKELARLDAKGLKRPSKLRIGAMFEVPSLLFEIDELMRKVDFVSIGSNDLSQFLFAVDRGNQRVATRYDSLSPPLLRALRTIVKAGRRHKVPVTLCGEMAGRPLEAMALIGLGFRSISMAPASIGPVKTMILSLDARRVTSLLDDLLKAGCDNIRAELLRFAEGDSVEL